MEMMINNVVLLFAATNKETPYEQLLQYCFLALLPERSRDPFLESPDKAVVVCVQDKNRLFTVPYFFVRSFRYTASYRQYLHLT